MVGRLCTEATRFTLANPHLSANWQLEHCLLRPVSCDMSGGEPVHLSQPFTLQLQDGTLYCSSELPVHHIKQHGSQLRGIWEIDSLGLRMEWQATLQTHFLRQHLTLIARRDIAIAKVILVDGFIPSAKPSGTLAGCPLITTQHWYGFEHPLAQHEVNPQGHVLAYLMRQLPLRAGQRVSYSSAIGVAADAQLRRAFSDYLETIRPRRTQPMLHYNCWYDLSYSNMRYDEAGILRTIDAWGQRLKLDAIVLDDGWDNPKRLWHMHSGFPKGFARISRRLRRYGMRLGIWLSPWGGYGEEKVQRLASAAALGMEHNTHGLALSGARYYPYFEKVCRLFVRKWGATHFKLDGMGKTDSVAQDSAFDSDFDAAITLISDIRKQQPALYINLTVGTYASPYWLLYADSIWRGGADHGFAGAGSDRQQWLTYRDGEVWKHVVQQSSLFPLASLMLHGIILAPHCPKLNVTSDIDFAAEAQSFFASGTQCQELYIRPDLLSESQWKMLQEAALFATLHAALLRDSHWVGGNPLAGEIYGWAAWKETEAMLTLRNPSDVPQSITRCLKEWLELPESVSGDMAAQPLFVHRSHSPESWNIYEEMPITLAPFEVITWYLRRADNNDKAPPPPPADSASKPA